MYFRRLLWKKLAALGLALGMLVSGLPVPQGTEDVKAAQESEVRRAGKDQAVTVESVRSEAAFRYESDALGFDLVFENEFTGSSDSWLDYSADTDGRRYMEVFHNIRTGEDDHTILFRFKTTGDGVLFGIGAGLQNDGKSLLLSIVGGQLRFVSCNTPNTGSDASALKGNFGSGLANGQYHTVAISFLPSLGFSGNVNCHVVIDGGEDGCAGFDWGTKWKPGLNQVAEEFDKFWIGGGFTQSIGGGARDNLNGAIDFLTVINRAYSAEELKDITAGDKDVFAEMWTPNTCKTWLFTGGTEGVADFSASRTTRNWVGLFESLMRESGSFVQRGRFVFNTSKRGQDIAGVLEEYDTRIAPYGTKAVGIMIGASDYQKGQEGIEEFRENLRKVLDRLKEDEKLAVLLTPYPSVNASDREEIARYTKAIRQMAEKGVKVVDLSGLSEDYLNEDGSLTPAGHQAVGNKLTDAVGGTRTNYSFSQLSDGAYTVAKKEETGAFAKVKEVIGKEDGIAVSVDEQSVSGNEVRLAYTLTDTSGGEITSPVLAGESDFTIDGLKKGETYRLNVYDISRGEVWESYCPVRITVIEGAKGVSEKYEDKNTAVNEKIRGLLERETPVTYLFMGDSITHGVVTEGYDNVPQLFAKYLDELGRTDDVVLNTGVTNATIATTLDQIEPRLMRYRPDVVMIMLGTNDSSNRGENTVTGEASANLHGITVEQYKERYKELIGKVHETNKDASVVLRVPCPMVGQTLTPHEGYKEKFAAIYEIAEEMRADIPGLNIAVVDHHQEWENYRDTVRNDNLTTSGYGWLVNDGVHPNGRGNIAMFQQIIKELGLYDPVSELADNRYALNEWTGTSEISAPVIQRAGRASFSMNALSGYTNGLRSVTLSFAADGRSTAKTAEYAENKTIALDGLDVLKTYEARVTGKDAVTGKEIEFSASLTKGALDTATEEERKELTDGLLEAEIPKEEEARYPAAALAAYKAALKDIRLLYEDMEDLAVEELDEALTRLRVARAGLELALEEERIKAAERLADAVRLSEETYQAPSGRYDMLESWDAYQEAYNAAKSVDADADIQTLNRLLGELQAQEVKLMEEKAEADRVRGEEAKKLDSAILAAEQTYQKAYPNYTSLKSWNRFLEAYNAAKAYDENTDTDTIKNLLGKLLEEEKKLKDEIAEAEKKDPGSGNEMPKGDGQQNNSNAADKIEQGKIYESGGYRYKALSCSKKTAEVVGTAGKKNPAKIKVNGKVTLGGDSYKIISVAKGAFQGIKTASSAVIGENVESIGAGAFSGCSKLMTVELKGRKLKTIGEKAFFQCKKLKKITIRSISLKKAGKNMLKGTSAKLVIRVPKAKYKTYRNTLKKKGQRKTAAIKKI